MTQTATLAVEESTTKDNFGRDICTQNKDFWAYLSRKRMTREDVLKLKPEQREIFFMKWKHGLNDMNVNWEFEYSLRGFIKSFKDVPLEQIEPSFRDIVKTRREFETYCDSIKNQISLWTGQAKREVVPELQELVDMTGGTLVSEGVEKKLF